MTIDQSLKKGVRDLNANIGGVDQGFLEIEVDGNKFLLFAKDEHYCLIVVQTRIKQVTLRKIIRLIRTLGFKTLVYPGEKSWDFPKLSAYAFFKKKDGRKSLQIKTDRIFARLTGTIKKLTRLWNQKS